MPTTSAGEPRRIASVKRLRTIVSSVRRVRTRHWVSPLATRSADARRAVGVGLPAGRRPRRLPVGLRSSIGHAAVEVGDRADLEALECLVERADESDSSTACHEHDAVARGEVLDGVRREHNRRRSVGQLAKPSDQLRARDRVEARRRLVEEEDVRMREQLDGDARPLALSTAERTDPHVGLLAQTHRIDRVARRRRRPRQRLVDDGSRRRAA